VWFCGNHGDVGGGWAHSGGTLAADRQSYIPVALQPDAAASDADGTATAQWLPSHTDGTLNVSKDHALSIVALQWMLDKAEMQGLPLKAGWRLTQSSLIALAEQGYEHAYDVYKLENGANTVFGVPIVREVDVKASQTHKSVLWRMAFPSARYAPLNPQAVLDGMIHSNGDDISVQGCIITRAVTELAAGKADDDGNVTWAGAADCTISLDPQVEEPAPTAAASTAPSRLRRGAAVAAASAAPATVNVSRVGSTDAWYWLVPMHARPPLKPRRVDL
jgi:hypothetical protein